MCHGTVRNVSKNCHAFLERCQHSQAMLGWHCAVKIHRFPVGCPSYVRDRAEAAGVHFPRNVPDMTGASGGNFGFGVPGFSR